MKATGRGSRHGHSWLADGAVAAVLLVIAAVTAACGGSSGSSGGLPGYVNGTPGSVLAFVNCMRTHGVPSFPVPDAAGQINLSGINRNSPRVVRAFEACGATGPFNDSGERARDMTRLLKFAHCMRAHGVLNFPDPNPGHGGSVHTSSQGGDTSSQGGDRQVVQRAATACRPLLTGRNPTAGSTP